MNITIRRYSQKSAITEQGQSDTVDGHLYIDGQKVCDTAENALYCLPQGTYPLEIRKCHFRGRKMPCIVIPIHDEPACSICSKSEGVGINSSPHREGSGDALYCPQLCPGNGVYSRTDGSILLGTYVAPGCLIHPREAFATLYDRLRKSAKRGHKITLTIVNEF